MQQTATVSHAALDLLLYRFLQELIYLKDAKGLFLRPDSITVRQVDAEWVIETSLVGEKLDPARHRSSVDVKAATFNELQLEKRGAGWYARFVLDI